VKARLALGVAGAWVLVGVLWAAQTTLGSALGDGQPMALPEALRGALLQTVPWIPVTLAVVWLGARVPLTRARWWRPALVHLATAAALAFVANVILVLGYWTLSGRFDGVVALAQSGARWAAIRFHVALVIYAAILAITQGVLYYRRTRERELQVARLEGQLARARLDALTAQIRPHFLFNTLHTIGQLWRSGRSDEADAVLDHLGSLFHKVQHCTARAEVPLAEELELVREYLAIEQARFRDRLRATVTASPEALDRQVPPLILQPLVENAVRHGISAASTAGAVEVCAAVRDGRLVLHVRDDGPGVNGAASGTSPGAPNGAGDGTTNGARARAGGGTGLRNTRERLAQLYGASAELRVESPPGGGTIVTIDIGGGARG
jgi:two-component system, LytTR family, sensor kinase